MTASVQPDASTETASVPTHLVPQAIDHQPPPMGIVAGQIDTLAPANPEQEPAGPPPRDHVAAKMLEDPADLGMLQREEAGDDAGRHFGERGHAAIVPGPGADQRTGSASSSTEVLDAAVEAALLASFDRSAFRMLTPGDIAAVVVPIIAAAVEAQARADGATAERERMAALAILNDLYDESDCQFDHHGYCQAHGWLTDGECPDARAKRLLTEVRDRTAIARAGTSGATP